MKVLKIVAAIGGAAMVVLGVAMALTNPSQDTYEAYAVEQLTTYLKEEACMEVPSVFGNVLQRQCKTFVDTGRPKIQQIIAQTTQRQNFIFFSIYRTNLTIGPVLPVYHFETLGVFQNFYIYQAEQQ
ncbi:MAG: DUF4359 domain-containing protein [Coleofasciculus sp. Co-bin14]|nr:DUF4359 domain-containing protein [Coleofasciculus sp. Co-bin14]